MHENAYQCLYRSPSAPVHRVLKALSRKSFRSADFWGARGSLTSVRDPWPFARPVPSRSCVAGHGRSLRFATAEGPGLRPGTPARFARPTLARREVGVISVGHSIAACHSGWRTRRCFWCDS